MRCYYREKIYISGQYAEIDVYPVFADSVRSRRKKKAKPTSEVQSQLNARNAQRRAIRLINANFTVEDIKCELTYSDKYLPADAEGAQRQLQNFFRRMKRLRRKKELGELKYFSTTEQGEQNGRLHHHVICSGGLLPSEIAQLWGKGYVLKIQPLQFNEEGVVGLARYFTKEKSLYRRYNASRNLVSPIEYERTGEISQRDVKKIAECGEDTGAASMHYCKENSDSWRITSSRVIMNEFNGLPYITIRMCREKGRYAVGFGKGA
jgi:hypothetical protein